MRIDEHTPISAIAEQLARGPRDIDRPPAPEAGVRPRRAATSPGVTRGSGRRDLGEDEVFNLWPYGPPTEVRRRMPAELRIRVEKRMRHSYRCAMGPPSVDEIIARAKAKVRRKCK